MNRKQIALLAGAAVVLAGGVAAAARRGPQGLALTGVVTTDEVVVSPLVAGRLVALHVREGEAVSRGQLLAELAPAELEAERSYFARSAEVLAAAVDERGANAAAEAREDAARVRQAGAAVAVAEAERTAAAAQLDDASATWERQARLAREGSGTVEAEEHARRALEAARARAAALDREVDARRAALELAQAGAARAGAAARPSRGRASRRSRPRRSAPGRTCASARRASPRRSTAS
ncbi:MAG: biotin/lipoyl-binding protein [Anaeromyxobacter sp.]